MVFWLSAQIKRRVEDKRKDEIPYTPEALTIGDCTITINDGVQKETTTDMDIADSEDINREPAQRSISENRDYVFRMLRAMGCQPEPGEDNDILARFQSELIVFRPINGYETAICDPSWGVIQYDDKDVPLMFEAINQVNVLTCPVKLFWTKNNNENSYVLNSTVTMILDPQCSNNMFFLHKIMLHFFQVKQTLSEVFNRIKSVQQSLN